MSLLPVLGVSAAAVLGVFLSKKFYFDGGSFNDTSISLYGKTVIITGANTGIGKETAIDLAKRGARIILACRDQEKAQKAAQEIRKTSGNGNVHVESLDLASLESVRQFAGKINAQEERIDILINNAGVMACPQWKTKDGFEMQFGTNHLGHFLLTNLLLDKIKASAPSRIINVSSLASEKGVMKWDDLMHDQNYEPRVVYRQSKLCNILFTRELAKRLEGTRVTVNALHPGVVLTELGKHLGETIGIRFTITKIVLYPFILWMLKSPRQGAQTTLYCALSKDLDNVTGRYFADCKEKPLLPHTLNDDEALRLWQISDKMCNPNKN